MIGRKSNQFSAKSKSDDKSELLNPEVMLKTLKTAYLFTKDNSSIIMGFGRRNLSTEDERKLGETLARYWMLEIPKIKNKK
jgi:hypothetical protein